MRRPRSSAGAWPTIDTVGEFAAVPTTGGKSGLCGPESPLSSQIPDGSGGNIERTPNSPTVSILGLMATACTADHKSGSPSTSNDDWPFEQSQDQSGTQSPPAGDTLAANPDGNRPAPTQSGQDGVYSGSAFPMNTGGGVCIRKERISDFRVEGDSV